MRILWFNWKDIQHPGAGGAEVYTHEIAERLVKKGHEVTLFTSSFPSAKEKTEINGVIIIRKGKIVGLLNTVYSYAKRFYRQHEGEFDIIIDEINTRPFLTPKYVKKPIVTLIHQLAVEFWDYKTPFPISIIGKSILEPYWLRLYKNIPTITVSESTKEDLEKFGFRYVEIVYNGLDKNVPKGIPEKYKEFTVVFVGRITPTKKPEDAIKAFQIANTGRLVMIGHGELLKKLKKEYQTERIEFKGFLPSSERDRIMKKAHVILVPGIREGWGRVVIEANAFGTPAIGYNIPGLKDSIRHGYNGLLCEPTPTAMANALRRIYDDEKLRKKLSENALDWARRFSWDKSAEKFERILKSILGE